jgi:hypothetical protein
MPVTSLARAEARFLDVRDAFDAADLAEARGLAAARSRQQAATTLAELAPPGNSSGLAPLRPRQCLCAAGTPR